MYGLGVTSYWFISNKVLKLLEKNINIYTFGLLFTSKIKGDLSPKKAWTKFFLVIIIQRAFGNSFNYVTLYISWYKYTLY